MVMNEMEGGRRDYDRLRTNPRNKQSSQSRPSRGADISGELLPMDTLQSRHCLSRPSSPTTNKNTQFSTSYNSRDNNNRNTQTS
jgi:hypothetical protein